MGALDVLVMKVLRSGRKNRLVGSSTVTCAQKGKRELGCRAAQKSREVKEVEALAI